MNILAGNLSLEYNLLKAEIDSAISRVLKSGWFVLGNEVSEFEKSFADYCKTKFCIGVASGTEALTLALMVSEVGYDDIVITVPNTAVPTVSAISMAGAKPIFVDVNKETMLMDPDALRTLLKNLKHDVIRRVKAIVPVHLYGLPCLMYDILDIAKEFGLKVVEDCAQAHGAMYSGKKAGSFGDMGCFSFYPSKNLGCYGDGGAIVTDNEYLYNRMLKLRNYGQEKRYHHIIKGINSRLDELQAAILRVKLGYLDLWNNRRREIAESYKKGLSGYPVNFQLVPGDNYHHVYHQIVISCDKRDDLIDYLTKRGIQTLIHYPIPVHLQEAYADMGYREGDFPVAEHLCKRILSLPIYPQLKKEEVDFVIGKIREFFQ
ncbi:MAG: DegT/DnrJ/EryC1/StrS family aminotransferase [Thermodesulfovibrionales bacterium]